MGQTASVRAATSPAPPSETLHNYRHSPHHSGVCARHGAPDAAGFCKSAAARRREKFRETAVGGCAGADGQKRVEWGQSIRVLV